ncbi:MAG: glycosyltransferase family 2 protein [Bacteroidales bacterium]
MSESNRKKIGAVSMVRNDQFFIPRWIDYYGKELGHENLFLFIDGHDQPLPDDHAAINVIRLPRQRLNRSRGDKNRIDLISNFTKALFLRYDIVIAHDIDEALVVDPDRGVSLSDYLQKPVKSASLSALGLDVGQHLGLEKPIDPSRPFLEQRNFAHVSARYTKAIVAFRPLKWGSGFHRVKYRNFHIDPNLFLFHFGMVDYEISKQKMEDQSLLNAGWRGHLDRRYELFDLITKKDSVDGDAFFEQARRRESIFRPLFALNKPGMLTEKPVVRIPERFRSIV